MRIKKIVGEFSAGKRIEEFLRVVEARAEFRDDLIGIVGDVRILIFTSAFAPSSMA